MKKVAYFQKQLFAMDKVNLFPTLTDKTSHVITDHQGIRCKDMGRSQMLLGANPCRSAAFFLLLRQGNQLVQTQEWLIISVVMFMRQNDFLEHRDLNVLLSQTIQTTVI